MNSDDLAVFLHVANSGSFSRSAIDLRMSQAALSRRVAALEGELATRLFYRSGRGVTLTENGRRLCGYAGDVQALLETATAGMAEAVRQGPASIVIAAQPTIGRMIFGTVGKMLTESYPGIRVRFREGLAGHIRDWVAAGDVDMAIIYLPESHSLLQVDVVLRERLSFVAPMQFGPLGASFPVKRLCDVPLILPSSPHGLRVLAETLCAREGGAVRVSMECDASVYITKQLVAENCGCTILPLAAVKEEVRAGTLQVAPLAEPEVVREIAIISSRNRPPLAGQWDVMQRVKAEVANLVRTGLWPDASVAASCSAAHLADQ